MASMRDIKRRKSSISSTQQITKAMKLVSTVKFQKAKTRAEETSMYFEYMYKTVCSVLAKAGSVNHPFLQQNDSQRKAVIALTSNRGLAGGYNSSIVKIVAGMDIPKEEMDIYAIGHKGMEGLSHKGYTIKKDFSEIMEAPTYADAMSVCSELLKAYADGEIGEIYLAYTYFKNTVSHEPRVIKLLPVDIDEADVEEAKGAEAIMNFEPNEEEAINLIVPKYVTSLIYGALVEAVASENAARMQAMDSATSNAEEMISDLSLKYNRARQGSITQELTEIIAGAEAIS